MQVLNRRDHSVTIDSSHIYVGRPSPWGNPYRVDIDITREEAVDQFRNYAVERLAAEPDWLVPLYEAEALVCWCAPLACHADVLRELIDANS